MELEVGDLADVSGELNGEMNREDGFQGSPETSLCLSSGNNTHRQGIGISKVHNIDEEDISGYQELTDC